MRKIPFTKLNFDKEEEKAVKRCMRSGWVVLGPKTLEFERKFADYVGAKYAVFVDSGTAALDLSVKLRLGGAKTVKIPSLTFVSDAEVLVHNGIKPEFVDVNMKSLCTEIGDNDCIPTNFAGRLADNGNAIIDSCHRIERYDVRNAKNPDSLWCYSFYATKNMSTVQGGMIAMNDLDAYKWLLMARDHGATKGTKQRYEGKNPIYDVEFCGWRVKPDDLRASIGLVQLEKLPYANARRDEIVKRYNENLGLDNVGNHIYPVFVDKREEFIHNMLKKRIQTSVHFRPIHTLTAYKEPGVKLKTTDFIADKIVSLPMFPDMTNADVDRVSKEVLKTKQLILI